MFINETFNIDRLICYTSLNNTVAAVQYTFSFDNLVDKEVLFSRVVFLPLPSDSNFIPYENLTEETIKEWVLNTDKECIEYFRRKSLFEMVENNFSSITETNNLPWNN